MDGEQPSASLTVDEPPVPETVRAVVVMPAYNAASTLERTVSDLPADGIAEVVVMIHPDYQYDARLLGVATEILRLGICDCVLGSRIRTRREALAGGMPRWKYLANRVLTTVENMALGQNLGDFHSGFRAYRREVLETIPYESNSDDFVFDSQFLAQAVHFGFKLGDIPVPVRYFDEASSINLWRSIRYGLGTLGVLTRLFAAPGQGAN